MLNFSILSGFILLFSGSVLAEASGPDFFQVREGEVATVFDQPDSRSHKIASLYSWDGALVNKGCQGGASFAEWQKMSAQQRVKDAAERWCHIENDGLQGWVANTKLRESAAATAPTFACEGDQMLQVEKLICNDPDLMARDQKMDAVFKKAVSRAQALDEGASQAVKTLQAYQRGWIKGRNECWKAADAVKNCVQDTYDRRIALLAGQWMLAHPFAVYHYVCEDTKANKFQATFYDTFPLGSVAIEYGDAREILVATPAASGSKYTGNAGKVFWSKGQEATFVWDQMKPAQSCVVQPD